jgi:hypothetical protein
VQYPTHARLSALATHKNPARIDLPRDAPV